MVNSPIWKDIELTSTADTLDYEIWDESAHTIHNGITMRMPDNTGITLNVNTRLEEYLKPDFASDFTDTADDVLNNPNGYREFRYRIPGEILETYGFLYDWSYEENWTGQTRYNMTKPINGHIDERMKCMFTNYDTGVTSFDWTIEYTPTMKLSDDTLKFKVPAGDSRQLTIVTNSDWEITSMPSWLSADTMSGQGCYSAKTNDVVTFTTTSNNPDSTNRTSNIVISFDNGNSSKVVAVKQYGIFLSVEPTRITIPMSGGTFALSVRYNYMFSIDSHPNWISISGDPMVPRDGGADVYTITKYVQPNTLGVNRSGEIRFVQDNVVVVVNVNQEGYIFTLTPQSMTMDATGQTKTVSVTTNTDWLVSTKPDWITISPSAGTSGNYTLNVTSTPNTTDGLRSDYVSFLYAASAGSKTLSISQESALVVSPTYLSYPLEGGSKSINIKSEIPFHISGSTFSGLTFSRTSGSTGGNVTVTCEARASAETNYSYEFTVYNQYKSVKVYVVQAAQWNPTGGIALHTTYLVTGDTDGICYLYSSNRGYPFTQLSIDGGAPIDVSRNQSYNVTLSPGIHTVDYAVSGYPSYSFESSSNNLFSNTTLYTLEANDGFSAGTTGTTAITTSQHLNISGAKYLKEVYTGGFTHLDVNYDNTSLETVKTGSWIYSITYFNAFNCKTIGPLSNYYSFDFKSPYFQYAGRMGTYQVEKYGYGPGPFYQLSAFTGTSDLTADNGRILYNTRDYSTNPLGSYQYSYTYNQSISAAATYGLTAYTIPSGIKHIDFMSFCGQPISKLTIPNTVERIEHSFMQYSNISEWNIPSSVNYVGGEVNRCEWWIQQEGPLCIKDGWCIATKGFSGTVMEIPEGVIGTSVGGFNDYYSSDWDANYYEPLGSENRSVISAVTTVILPSTLKYLSDASFDNRWPSSGYGWNSLSEIYCYATTAPQITNPNGFIGIRNGGTLHVPAGSDYSSWMTFYYASPGSSSRSNYGLSAKYWSIVYDLPPVPQPERYLTFNITGDGYINLMRIGSTVKSIEYRKNYGAWTSISPTTSGNKINVTSGDLVEFRGEHASYNGFATFSGTTATFTLEGNIMSLIAKTGFNTLTNLTDNGNFISLFAGCTGLTDASNLVLPAVTLTSSCYKDMFDGCTSLVSAPALLPATTLRNSSYSGMFRGCSSLVNAPQMAVTTPGYLSCYQMFYRTSLRTAPTLSAATLDEFCYQEMFYGCSGLTSVTCLATDISAGYCTTHWLTGVAPTGTFTKAASMNDWEIGTIKGIPSGWTVTDAQ